MEDAQDRMLAHAAQVKAAWQRRAALRPRRAQDAEWSALMPDGMPRLDTMPTRRFIALPTARGLAVMHWRALRSREAEDVGLVSPRIYVATFYLDGLPIGRASMWKFGIDQEAGNFWEAMDALSQTHADAYAVLETHYWLEELVDSKLLFIEHIEMMPGFDATSLWAPLMREFLRRHQARDVWLVFGQPAPQDVFEMQGGDEAAKRKFARRTAALRRLYARELGAEVLPHEVGLGGVPWIARPCLAARSDM